MNHTRRANALRAAAVFALLAVGPAVACSLNPQPFPPENTATVTDGGAPARDASLSDFSDAGASGGFEGGLPNADGDSGLDDGGLDGGAPDGAVDDGGASDAAPADDAAAGG